MFKQLQSHLFSFDLEWVPDPLAAKQLHGVEHDPPYSIESAMKTLWQRAGATEEQPQPYLKTVLCRIVTVAGIYRENTDTGASHKLISLPHDLEDSAKCEEDALLNGFLKSLGSKKPQLVGYNSSNSDLPILVERSIVHGLPSHGFAERPDKPWEGADYFSMHADQHIDLAQPLGKWNMKPRLHEIATLCGIPGKIDISGDSVAQLWMQGKLETIRNYNEYDALTTHLLWARMAHFNGLLSPDAYDQEQLRIKELLETEISNGKAHLEPYLTEWLRRNPALTTDNS